MLSTNKTEKRNRQPADAMKRVLETVLKNGAVIAEPGEFTKRAFLNGRLDLSQA